MNRLSFVFCFLVLLLGCSNPNEPYIAKIKQQVKEDALGVEMNYMNIEFQWIDTLFVRDKLSNLKRNFDEKLNAILKIEYYVQDNFVNGTIFSKDYLTLARVIELRNWENKNRGIPFNNEYKEYYLFAFANRDASSWISELCSQIEETDILIENYDEIEEGNLKFLENILWYYKRINSYNSNNTPNIIWHEVLNQIQELKIIQKEIDQLSSSNTDDVIHYKALNIYKINNPFLNGAEQEIKRIFLFDNSLDIIGSENL